MKPMFFFRDPAGSVLVGGFESINMVDREASSIFSNPLEYRSKGRNRSNEEWNVLVYYRDGNAQAARVSISGSSLPVRADSKVPFPFLLSVSAVYFFNFIFFDYSSAGIHASVH